jgi:hypothetical protein
VNSSDSTASASVGYASHHQRAFSREKLNQSVCISGPAYPLCNQAGQQVAPIPASVSHQTNAFPEWQVGPHYIVERVLGTGSYGSVCRAT